MPTDPTQAVENSKRKHDTAAQEKAAIAAASDAVGAGGLGVGSVELVLEKEANAWTALAARKTGAWAQIVRDGAADISRMAKSFSTVGAASSVLTGSYEGLTSESVAGKGHGWSMATLGAAAGFRLISAPAALGIEAADAIVQHTDLTVPATGEKVSGWGGLLKVQAEIANKKAQLGEY